MQGKMRKACGLAAEALVLACEAAKAGVTTDEAWLLPNTESFRKALCSMAFLAVLAADFLLFGIPEGGPPNRRICHWSWGLSGGHQLLWLPARAVCVTQRSSSARGAKHTSFGGRRGIVWICQSEVVVSENVLHVSGDIVNFDVTVYLDGAFGDCSAMVCVGNIDENARFLVDATKQCLDEAVELVGPGQEPDTDSASCSGAIFYQDLSGCHSSASFHSMVCGMVFDVAHSCVLFAIFLHSSISDLHFIAFHCVFQRIEGPRVWAKDWLWLTPPYSAYCRTEVESNRSVLLRVCKEAGPACYSPEDL